MYKRKDKKTFQNLSNIGDLLPCCLTKEQQSNFRELMLSLETLIPASKLNKITN